MLFQSSSDDQALIESFYGELFNRFFSACDSSARLLLCECALGIAPGPKSVKTFFIVAPSQSIAEQLTRHVDNIIEQVLRLMPGVEQTAICFLPPEGQANHAIEHQNFKQSPSKIIGKFFSNFSEPQNN